MKHAALLLALLGAAPLVRAQASPPRLPRPDLAFAHVGSSLGMGLHGRLGVRVARAPVFVHVRGTNWPAEMQIFGGESATSVALLGTYAPPLPGPAYVRAGAGLSRFERTRRGRSTAGFGILPSYEYVRSEAVGVALESTLGVPLGPFAAAEVVVLGDLNRADTRFGLGVSLGLRIPGAPLR